MAPDCKSGARKRYAGSNPALPSSRALHSGNALAFQARVAGSIPAARSTKTPLQRGFLLEELEEVQNQMHTLF